MAEGDVKPKVGEGTTITLRVKNQAGSETFFKVKPTTRLDKVFDAYAQRSGSDRAHLRFMYDGDRLDGNQTPESLEMSDNDQIDVMLEQQGGC